LALGGLEHGNGSLARKMRQRNRVRKNRQAGGCAKTDNAAKCGSNSAAKCGSQGAQNVAVQVRKMWQWGAQNATPY